MKSSYMNQEKELQDNGIDYYCEISGGTKKIYIEDDPKPIVIRESFDLKGVDLSLISMVKRDAKKFLEEKGEISVSSGDVRYIDFNMNIPCGQYTDVAEFDLNSAYWELAKYHGFISDKTYNFAKKKTKKGEPLISKKGRLVALGSIATSTMSYRYVKGKYEDLDEKRLPTSGMFFTCAKEVADQMTRAMDTFGNDLFFYYVDAIFCTRKVSPDMCQFIEDDGMKLKYVPLEYINIMPAKAEAKIEGGKVKPYTRFSLKQKKYSEIQVQRKIEKIWQS